MTISARLSKPEVIDTYRGTARVYDAWAALTETRARARSLEVAQIRDGERILEVAVGTGGTFEQILRENPHGFNEGVDLTDAMLARAKHKAARVKHDNYRLRLGDAYQLEFEDESFDLLVNNYMFDLLPEQDFDLVLAEFRRVLKPGGRLLLVNMAPAWRFYQGVYEAIYRVNPRWMGGCRGVDLAAALSRAGFETQVRERISQLAFPSEILLVRKTAAPPA